MVQKPLIKQGYSLAEEIANSVSHGIGLVFGIVGLVFFSLVWYRLAGVAGVATGSGGGSQCQRHGDNPSVTASMAAV